MKISLCIPTYNRAYQVMSLIAYLRTELSTFDCKDDVEVRISDNCSNDNTEAFINDYLAANDYPVSIIYSRNEHNIGGINNFIKLANEAKGEYLWWMGDDDKYYPGLMKRVWDVINTEAPAYIFINHNVLRNGKIIRDSAILNVDYKKRSQDVLLDILESTGTTLMFMSASIHIRENVLTKIEDGFEINSAMPLLMVFYSASKGAVSIIPEIMLEDEIGNISWADRKDRIFFHDVPYAVRQCLHMGYNKKRIMKYLASYYWVRKKNIIKYLIRNAIK